MYNMIALVLLGAVCIFIGLELGIYLHRYPAYKYANDKEKVKRSLIFVKSLKKKFTENYYAGISSTVDSVKISSIYSTIVKRELHKMINEGIIYEISENDSILKITLTSIK